jgi:hypothetical protein
MNAQTLQSIIDAVNHNAHILDLTQKRYAHGARTLRLLMNDAEGAWTSPVAKTYVTGGRELVGTMESIGESLDSVLDALRILGRTATNLRTQLLGAERRLSEAHSAIAGYEDLIRGTDPANGLRIADLQASQDHCRGEVRSALREIERIQQQWEQACRECSSATSAAVALMPEVAGPLFEQVRTYFAEVLAVMRPLFRVETAVSQASALGLLVGRPVFSYLDKKRSLRFDAQWELHKGTPTLRDKLGRFARNWPRHNAKVALAEYRLRPAEWKGYFRSLWRPITSLHESARRLTPKTFFSTTKAFPGLLTDLRNLRTGTETNRVFVGSRALSARASSGLRVVGRTAPVFGIVVSGYSLTDAVITARADGASGLDVIRDADVALAGAYLVGSVLMLTPATAPFGAAVVVGAMVYEHRDVLMNAASNVRRLFGSRSAGVRT